LEDCLQPLEGALQVLVIADRLDGHLRSPRRC
jgi:hypothetical protein